MAGIEDFNGTRSIIIDQINQLFQRPTTADSILVIGTAQRGPLRQLNAGQDDLQVQQTYGDVPNDPSFDTNLPRTYYEVSRSTGNGADAFLMRIGDAKKATLNLYESQGLGGTGYGTFGSGDLAYTKDTTNNALAFSLINEALIEGAEANNGSIDVIDEDGVPKAITFTTPDGVRKSFALDPFRRQPGALYNVRDIANTFNADADWKKWYITRYVTLRKTDLELTVQADANGGRYVEIDGGTESFGDKLEALEELAIEQSDATDNIPFGVTSYFLTNIPKKDSLDVTATITEFIRNLKDEVVVTIDETLVGSQTYNKTLFLGKTNSKWDTDIGFVWSTTQSAAEYANFTLIQQKPNGNRIEVPKVYNSLPVYTVDSSGQILINLANYGDTQFQLGDSYLASYRFKAFFREANLRSQLEIGNEFSYFVKGNEIIFGASLSLALDVVYATRKVFAPSDVNLTDANNIIVYFINPLTRPDVGGTVLATYTYLPELPASSAAILDLPTSGQVVQKSGFSGGDDGRRVGKLRYKQLVEDALSLVELYPFKQVLVAGCYLDDVVDGYDDETGLPAVIPVDWTSMLTPLIARRSFLTKECTMAVSIRPPTNLTPEGINKWFDRAIVSDSTDVGRPANMMEAAQGPDSFRLICPAGAPIVAISQVLGGRQYVAYPAAIMTGLRQDVPIESSSTNQLLPPNVLDLGIKVLNAEIVGNMNAKKYIFFTVDAAGNRLIADAPTLAQTGSNYDRLFVLDAVYAAINVVRITAARFIGLARSQENILAMRNKCQKNVSYLVPKVFQNIQINVMDVPDGSITGRTKLGLSMITSREIRRIDVETRITLV
jgi:hypothetical protein